MNVVFASTDLEHTITQLGTRTVVIAAVLLTILVIISAFVKNKKKHQKYKMPLFASMVAVLVASTLTLFGTTIYLNATSDSGGPVHWHADMEFWACGNELAIANPSGFLSNKVGTATYHEHNDKRIHLEGVVVNKEYDASLGKFMKVIGGYISENELVLPLAENTYETTHTDGDGPANLNPTALTQYVGEITNNPRSDSVATLPNAFDSSRGDQTCNGQPAYVQAFVYSFDNKTKTYSQNKIAVPQNYIIRDEGNVPPGDCVIVEFDIQKERTDKLCKQYGVRDQERCMAFGVPSDKVQKVCDIREVSTGGTL